jgi:hypothetical protein
MRRLRTVAFWRDAGGRLVFAVAVAASLLVLAIIVRAHDAQRTNEQICMKVNRLDGVLVDILRRSQKSIGMNTYYKHHPKELAQARRDNAKAIREFLDAGC